MRRQVQNIIAQFHMFPEKAHIVVGLSGGADSVALLHVLCSLKEEYGWRITAVHIHHGLRGKDADLDAAFAEAFCAEMGVSCVVRRVDVKAEAKERKLGEEETGRLLRYAVFREIAGEGGYIAVAHHQKDQAETMLMRLCRGTGLRGLAGMAPVRENICRPLLRCSREEIEWYCKENNLMWREDATNQEETYTRNKLRLRVLPLLEGINPKAVAHMAETAELLSAEEDFLEQQAAACYEAVKEEGPQGEVRLKRTKLREMHPAMKKRILRKAMAVFLQADISQAQIEALENLLEKETGKSRDFLEGIHAENRYDLLVLTGKKKNGAGYRYALPLGETVFLSEIGFNIMAWIGEKREVLSEDTKCFAFDRLQGEVFCRSRKTGDFISIKNGRKKIKDLLIDEKIPRSERETLPLITVGEEVLWAVGLRISEKYRPDAHTEKFLYVKIEKA